MREGEGGREGGRETERVREDRFDKCLMARKVACVPQHCNSSPLVCIYLPVYLYVCIVHEIEACVSNARVCMYGCSYLSEYVCICMYYVDSPLIP